MKLKNCLNLFLSFFKIGAFTFGGGYAMISLIEKEAEEKRGWIDSEEMIDIIAISESTPGPIAINSATFIGYKTAGTLGSVCATLGVILPSFIIISIISVFYEQFKSLTAVYSAFMGIRVCVVILMINALKKLSKQAERNILSLTVVLAAFIIATFTDIDVIFILITVGLISLFTNNKGGTKNGI